MRERERERETFLSLRTPPSPPRPSSPGRSAINEASSWLYRFIMIYESVIFDAIEKPITCSGTAGTALVIMSLTPPRNWVILLN